MPSLITVSLMLSLVSETTGTITDGIPLSVGLSTLSLAMESSDLPWASATAISAATFASCGYGL
ncbi:hypothetical protein D3C83_283990 [compost metagenome]